MATFNDEIDVFIEISKNSNIKYEYDDKNGRLICDRILQTPFKYDFNYGFIPDTISPDGDPLDVVVWMTDELVPGCYIKCKILGALETEDEHGIDPKLIVCPCSKVDPQYNEINDIHDLHSVALSKIKYFFQHYKDLENKKVIIGKWLNKNEALLLYENSINN